MDVERLTAQLVQSAERWSVPGAQVGLRVGDQRRVICAGVVGVEDHTPVSTETSFHAGSITKSLVGLVVLGAARRGQLDLDTPCAEQGGDGLWSETPRAMLSQTTGRPNVLPEAGESLEAFVARTGDLSRVHAPGRFSYCNAGWPALDLLLRRVTGRSFEEAAQELLGPLSFGVPDSAADAHQVAPGVPPSRVGQDDWPIASAAGARWFASADALLDYAGVHLGHSSAAHPEDVVALRTPSVRLPGHTVFDAWSLGFGVWDRGDHQAVGWAGYTSGHRTYLRCFPEQDAAVVVLTNCAGPMLGPPGGAALFDELLPTLLVELGVPPLVDPVWDVSPTPASELAGSCGPLVFTTGEGDGLVLDARAFGVAEPIPCRRRGGNTFTTADLGGMTLAFDDDLLYTGPFAMPRRV